MVYSQFCTNSMAIVTNTQVIRKECNFRVATTFVCHNSIIFLPSNLHFPILFIFSPNFLKNISSSHPGHLEIIEHRIHELHQLYKAETGEGNRDRGQIHVGIDA